MKFNRKTIIVLVIVAILLILLYNWNKKKQLERQAYEQQVAMQQTTGTGLIGYLSNLWNGKQSDGTMSESEALAISQKIADLIETETEGGQTQANAMIQELYVNGWKYVGYNKVEPVS